MLVIAICHGYTSHNSFTRFFPLEADNQVIIHYQKDPDDELEEEDDEEDDIEDDDFDDFDDEEWDIEEGDLEDDE